MLIRKALLATFALAMAAGAAMADDKPKYELKVAIAAPAVIYGPAYVALAEDLFAKNGLKVDLVSTNAMQTGSAMIVSEQADVVLTNAYLGLRIATEGKDLSYIMNLSGMGARVNAFISKPAIKSVQDLAAAGTNCRILLLPPGTGSWAILQGIIKKYGLKCTISTAGTMPNVVAGALSGQFDAAMVNPQDAYAARDAGKANILIDPLTISDEDATSLYPYSHPFSIAIGMRSTLAQKRGAVEIFIKTLREANQEIEKRSPEDLGQLLATRLPEVFGSTPASALALQWRIQQTLFPHSGNAGYITPDEWRTLISSGPALWGFANLKASDPTVAYDKVVDMSYFEASEKH